MFESLATQPLNGVKPAPREFLDKTKSELFIEIDSHVPLSSRIKHTPLLPYVEATGAQPGAKFNYADAPPAVLEKVRKVQAICARHAVSMKAAALQFPLAHPAVASVIPGARSVAELEENFRLIREPIPADFWAELRHQKILPPEAPTPGDS